MNVTPRIGTFAGAIEYLADSIVEVGFEVLPDAVVTEAKWRILDYFGSVLWGVHVGTAAQMRTVVEAFGGKPQAQVLGRPTRLPSVWAAYLNSCAAPALLDTCRRTASHPGIVVIPAALAAAEAANATGQDLIAGIVWGYEALIRLAGAVPFQERGFDATSVAGSFGAAAAAAKILKLSRETVANALALASSTSNGLSEAYAAIDSSRNQFGRASQSGLFAALLAKQGVIGNWKILEGGQFEDSQGLLTAFSDHSDESRLLAPLGSNWGVLQVGAKSHDGCRYTNAAADAILALVAEHKFSANDVRRIRVGTFERALALAVRQPTTVSGALFCIEFVVATAILTGDVFNDKFTLERLNDPAVRGLMSTVDVYLDEDLHGAYPTKLGLKMDVELRDGRAIQCEMSYPRGEPEFPLTAAEYERKFLTLSTPVLTEPVASRLMRACIELETIGSVTDLISHCASDASRSLN
jgi:2-methylcitrate dehydratase PrpD